MRTRLTRAENSRQADRGALCVSNDRLRHRHTAPRETSFCKRNQALGVRMPITSLRQHQLVARHLALKFQSSLHEPNCRMKKENCAENLTGKIRPIISATQVCEFVQKHCSKVLIGQLC